MITARYALEDLPHREVLLWWQRKNLSYTSTGYGKKIPTTHMVQLSGSTQWRRVYCCIYSNIGTCYVPDKQGNWTVIY